MDDIDRAQQREELDRSLAIAAQLHKPRPYRPKLIHVHTGQELCWKCSEPIDLNRLKINPDARLCFNCQSELEHLEDLRHV